MWVWGWAPETDAQDRRLVSSKGRQRSGRSCLLICLSGERRSALGRLSDPPCCEFRKIKGSDGPCPRDSAGWPSFPLHFGLDVHKKSYFSTRFLFPSCFLLPRQVVWTSIFLAEGSFIYSLVHCIFNTVFYSTNCQVLFNFLPGLELAPEDREMKNTQPWP